MHVSLDVNRGGLKKTEENLYCPCTFLTAVLTEAELLNEQDPARLEGPSPARVEYDVTTMRGKVWVVAATLGRKMGFAMQLIIVRIPIRRYICRGIFDFQEFKCLKEY